MPKLQADLQKARADTLELDPSEHDDPARQYLVARGVRLKTARAVLENLRRNHDFLPEGSKWEIDHPDAQSVINGWKRMKDGRTVYHIPRFALDSMANFKNCRRAEQQERSRQTRKAAKTYAEKTGKEKKKKTSVGRAL
jgi:hypothetical protein